MEVIQVFLYIKTALLLEMEMYLKKTGLPNQEVSMKIQSINTVTHTLKERSPMMLRPTGMKGMEK